MAAGGRERPGGTRGRELTWLLGITVEALGIAATYGVSPASLLRADAYERDLLIQAVNHAREEQDRRDQNLARMIVSEYAAAMKRAR